MTFDAKDVANFLRSVVAENTNLQYEDVIIRANEVEHGAKRAAEEAEEADIVPHAGREERPRRASLLAESDNDSHNQMAPRPTKTIF